MSESRACGKSLVDLLLVECSTWARSLSARVVVDVKDTGAARRLPRRSVSSGKVVGAAAEFVGALYAGDSVPMAGELRVAAVFVGVAGNSGVEGEFGLSTGVGG